MDLSTVSTKDLRAELHKRDEAAKTESWELFRSTYPCPECGGDPVSLNSNVVENFVFAPKDSEGQPVLYAPYEMGETHGVRYQKELTCVNGHVTYTDDIKWFDKPIPAPPSLRH